MFLTQYDEKKTLAMEREEGREEGKAEALKAVLLVLKAQGKTDEEIAEFEKQMAELAANEEVTREGGMKAFIALREEAARNGLTDMSLEEINNEIDRARYEGEAVG